MEAVMDDNLVQVYGRLTAHEFLLEVMYANWFAHMPESQARQMSSDLRKRVRKAYAAPDADQSAAANSAGQRHNDREISSEGRIS
jgi:hypothetical protein